MKKLFFGFFTKKTLPMLIAITLASVSLPLLAFANDTGEVGEIINGDFKNGITGYSKSSYMGCSSFNGYVTLQPIEDENTWYNSFFYQEITVEPNTDYVWNFQACKEFSDKDADFYVGIFNTDFSIVKSSFASTNATVTEASAWDEGTVIGYSQTSWSNRLHRSLCNGWNWNDFTLTFNSGNHSKVLLTLALPTKSYKTSTTNWKLRKSLGTGKISNGDFENGIKSFKTSSTVIADVSNDDVHGGNASVKLGANSDAWNNAYFYQEVEVKPNTDYIWDFWYKSGSGNNVLAGVRTEKGSELLPSYMSSEGGTVDSDTVSYNEIRSTSNELNWHQGLTDLEWKKYSIIFSSGDQSIVLITINEFYKNREGWTDDWEIKEIDPNVKTVITNGGFEDDLNGYTVSSTALPEIVSEDVHTGNKAAELSASDDAWNNAYLYQEVCVKPNTDYSWSFWIKSKTLNSVLAGVRTEDGTNLLPSTANGVNGIIDSSTVSFNELRNADTTSNWHTGMSNDVWIKYSITFNTRNQVKVLLTLDAFYKNRIVLTDDWEINEIDYNILSNSGFEDGKDEYTAVGTEISIDTLKQHSGNNCLKISGSGSLTRKIKVSPHYNYEWSFYCLSDSSVGFAVAKSDGKTLMPSVIKTTKGVGTATPETYDSERTVGYHMVTTNGVYTQYTVKFDSDVNQEVVLMYNSASNVVCYTDDWYLFGTNYFATEEFFNSGFEEECIDYYNSDGFIQYSVTNTDVHSGNKAMKLTKNGTKGYGEFRQSVHVKKNSNYMWTFWLKFNNNDTPVGAWIKQNRGSLLFSKIGGDCDSIVDPGYDWHRIRYHDNEWHQYKIFFNSANSDVVDFVIYAYAENPELVTDDWSLDYLGDAVEDDTIFNIDFENDNMGSLQSSKPIWAVSEEYAHSGKRSLKYNGKNATTADFLVYFDEYGVSPKLAMLEKNTMYRMSFWYKSTGKIEMADLKVKVSNYSDTFEFLEKYGTENDTWNYFEYDLDTADYSVYSFNILPVYVGSNSFEIYVDDIKLEKITVGITDESINPETIKCDDASNLIPTAERNLSLSSDNSVVKEFKLRPYGIYNFAFTSSSKNADAKIGLSFSNEGMAFSDGRSIFEFSDSSGENLRKGYTFCAPKDGIVYLIMNKTSGNLDVNDLTLYSVLPEPVSPKTDSGVVKPNKITASIWDAEFDFDFDWNINQEDFDEDFDYIDDPDDENISVDKKLTGKRYRQIKKRALVKKGEPGISTLTIVIICCGAALVVLASVFFIIYFVKKKKK